MKYALPIAAGYFPVAVSFGLTAVSAGLDGWLAVLMSLIVFAGASQFVGAGMFGMGVGGWEIVLTTFVLNFRHFLMSSSLSRRLPEATTKSQSALAAFGVTDETFAVASMSGEEKLTPSYLYGLNFTAYSAWASGTFVGVMAGSILSDTLKQSLTFGLYALFIGLLVPELKRTRPAVTAALCSMAVSGALYFQPFFELGSGWMIVGATIAGAFAAAVLHGEENEQA
ncbi:AzlC family ABC transporter permease [Geovibrio thiophilus]|uniref:AzlC family ABC transporter permease n=1 Tax=Geovibrio thiophilus TaxID=139438 RepID=UPI0013E2FB3E|nr:AzlC family ABC transporter permease [Geovibrio thiophilus]